MPAAALAVAAAAPDAVQLAAALALAAASAHLALRGEPAPAVAALIASVALSLHALPDPPGSALAFTLALVGAGAAPAAAAHLALRHPGARVLGALDRAAVAAGYVVTFGVLGMATALVLDPRRAGCFDCPRNLLLLHADPDAAAWLQRWAPRAAAVTEAALAVLVLARLAPRARVARGLALPVSVPVAAALVAASAASLRSAQELAVTGTDRALSIATAAAVGLAAAGVFWRPLREARTRAALGALVLEPEPDVRETLARALGDPDVRLLAAGADGPPSPGRARTPVERGGAVVAWIEHADTAELPPALARTAGLTVEREALRAALDLQAREIRDSTARLIAAGDAERRRLERDLHDGAQQRMLALGVALAREPRELAGAATRVGEIRAELRRIAHGIHSVTLAEGGLAEAVLALVAAAGRGVVVERLPDGPAAPEAEIAVHRLVAAALHGGATRLAIERVDGELRAELVLPGAVDLASPGARIAALGGSLEIDGVTARARVPAGAHPGAPGEIPVHAPM